MQAGNDGGWSNSASVTCFTLPGEPVVVCVAGSAQVSSFSVSWAAVGGADNYRARVDEGGWADVAGTSHAFSDLGSGGEFSAEVQADNGGLWGASGTATCFTLPGEPVVTCSAATAAGFTANWETVDGADKYRVRVDGGDWADASGTAHVFSGLSAGGLFSVEVQANNGGGWGAAGAVSCGTVPGAPGGLVCADERATSFAVSWSEVDGASKYQVRIGGGAWAASDSLSGHVFSGLSPNAEYSVAVQAGNDAGWGPGASVSCVAVPGGVECGATTATSVELVLQPEPAPEAKLVSLAPVQAPGSTVTAVLLSQADKHQEHRLALRPLSATAVHRVQVRWVKGAFIAGAVYETEVVCAAPGTKPQVSCSTSQRISAAWPSVPGPGVAYRAAAELIGDPIAGPPGRSPDPDGTTAVASYSGPANRFSAFNLWIGDHRVTVEARAGAGRWWPLGTADTACPDAAAQYRDLYLMSGAALQNTRGALNGAPAPYSLAQFIEQRDLYGTSLALGRPWMGWRTDGCPAPQGQNTDTYTGAFGATVSFRDACDRHDFTIQNLWRIEHSVDNTLDTWSHANQDAADDQLLEDLLATCNNNTTLNYYTSPECRQHARNIHLNINPNNPITDPPPPGQ